MVVSHFEDEFGIQRDDQVLVSMLVLVLDSLHTAHVHSQITVPQPPPLWTYTAANTGTCYNLFTYKLNSDLNLTTDYLHLVCNHT